MNNTISGFSKLSKKAKIEWVCAHFLNNSPQVITEIEHFWHSDDELQRVMDGFSENTISNFYMPYSIAPNFVIDGKAYAVPMVIEESSVVAAASAAAKYWMERGGFHTQIISTKKIGQVHFSWTGSIEVLRENLSDLKKVLLEESQYLTHSMEQRGGGVREIELLDFSDLEANYYQLRISFETCDSMGANFINTVLEQFGVTLKHFVETASFFQAEKDELTIIMAILSNYTPECLVRSWVECPIEALGTYNGMDADTLARKFAKAIRIAEIDPYRATTHNKGIFNGIDAIVLATANDFRAIEAGGHTYASRSGQYSSLSHCSLENGKFRFWLDIPLAVGTVGGLTKLHPLAKKTLEILGNPSAKELMSIIATVGLAQNFAAVRSLVTTGIQKGHMKMHLQNILNFIGATPEQNEAALVHFAEKPISFSAVRAYLTLK
ncbi:MAG: hypothetical protein RLZZ292_3989 [Bacteroidota bacterium]|jgi:hydroxymethylglutaryl-CoA reductase